MGSGGGLPNWPSNFSPGSRLEDAISEEDKSEFDISINSFLQDLLSSFNERDEDKIRTHTQTILDAIRQYVEGPINMLLGGSIKKHTFVDGLSDIDLLVTVNDSSLEDASPKKVLDYFAERLRERLPETDIKVGNLAVTLVFSDGYEIQVLPAIRTPNGLRISNADGSEWSNIINPDKFAQRLTTVNQEHSRRVVPVIKLIKGINSLLPTDVMLSGYHIESLAINAFKDPETPRNYKDMILHFFESSCMAILHPIRDSTGQSIHVDDYLGDAGSTLRQKVSSSLNRLVNRIKSANSEASIESWKEILDE